VGTPSAATCEPRPEFEAWTKIIYRIIAERRRTSDRDNRRPFCSTLLQVRDDDGSRMSDRQLRDETITLFLAGHDNHRAALPPPGAVWLLAQKPWCRKKETPRRSSIGVLAGAGVSVGRDDAVPKLAYLGLRLGCETSAALHPTAWRASRGALPQKRTEIAGYPAASRLRHGQRHSGWCTGCIRVGSMRRWRFRSGTLGNGFGQASCRSILRIFLLAAGPRQCIGNTFALMEASVVLATVGQKFRFQLVPGHRVTTLASITLRPRDGVRVTLEARGRKRAANSEIASSLERIKTPGFWRLAMGLWRVQTCLLQPHKRMSSAE